MEWVKEKVDSKIESYEKEKPIKEERKGFFERLVGKFYRFSKRMREEKISIPSDGIQLEGLLSIQEALLLGAE